MEGILFFSIVLCVFSETGYCELSAKFNDFMVNVRHAKKKDHANREERYYGKTYSSYEYDDYLWMSSTEDTTVYDSTTDYTFTEESVSSSSSSSASEMVTYGTTESEATSDESSVYDDMKEDVVTKFLRIVESQHELGDNCTAGTDLNLGEGVVDRYAQV